MHINTSFLLYKYGFQKRKIEFRHILDYARAIYLHTVYLHGLYVFVFGTGYTVWYTRISFKYDCILYNITSKLSKGSCRVIRPRVRITRPQLYTVNEEK